MEREKRHLLFMFFSTLEWKELVLSRQKEYKLAAINAKQVGDIERAKQFYLTSKVTQLN